MLSTRNSGCKGTVFLCYSKSMRFFFVAFLCFFGIYGYFCHWLRVHNGSIPPIMINGLSILIPSYNDPCDTLIRELHRQASLISTLQFEIVIGDDGSTNPETIARNLRSCELEGCRYFRSDQNIKSRRSLYSSAFHLFLGDASLRYLRSLISRQGGHVYK